MVAKDRTKIVLSYNLNTYKRGYSVKKYTVYCFPRMSNMTASKDPRFQFEVQLPSNESKASFSALLDDAKKFITPQGQIMLITMACSQSLLA